MWRNLVVIGALVAVLAPLPSAAQSSEAGAEQNVGAAPTQGESSRDRIRAAEKALQDAEAAQAAGVEPLPGERTGTAGGGSRLNEAYNERQQQLAAAVERARRDLEQARAAR